MRTRIYLRRKKIFVIKCIYNINYIKKNMHVKTKYLYTRYTDIYYVYINANMYIFKKKICILNIFII